MLEKVYGIHLTNSSQICNSFLVLWALLSSMCCLLEALFPPVFVLLLLFSLFILDICYSTGKLIRVYHGCEGTCSYPLRPFVHIFWKKKCLLRSSEHPFSWVVCLLVFDIGLHNFIYLLDIYPYEVSFQCIFSCSLTFPFHFVECVFVV